jgi:membrane protease YdiL (CAAX protease family)
MFVEIVPIFLGAALSWFRKVWPLTAIVLSAAYAGAMLSGFVRPIGIAGIVALAMLAYLCGKTPDGVRGIVLHSCFFVLAGLLSLHLFPGFQNPVLMGPVSFTQDAVPFKMYLNFDKSAVGFAVILFYIPLYRDTRVARTVLAGGLGAILAIFLTLPPALLLGAVRFEPKCPDGLWLWSLNNLLLVALAEETLFRGFLQASLSRWLEGIAGSTGIAIGVAALGFGVVHYASGPLMIILASLAGVAYGLAYRYGGLLASMLAHFGLNLFHLMFFTYPLLVPRSEVMG